MRNLFADGEVPGAEAWEQLGTCKLHGAAGCELWRHHCGFSCQINEILVLPTMFDALRTRLKLGRCQEQALWVPAARLGFGACPAHRMHAANAAASQQQKKGTSGNVTEPRRERRLLRLGEKAPGLWYKGNGSAEPGLCLTARAEGGGNLSPRCLQSTVRASNAL